MTLRLSTATQVRIARVILWTILPLLATVVVGALAFVAYVDPMSRLVLLCVGLAFLIMWAWAKVATHG